VGGIDGAVRIISADLEMGTLQQLHVSNNAALGSPMSSP